MDDSRISFPALASRWVVGMALVTWRYLWQVTPLHRSERHVASTTMPPELPDDLRGERLQPLGSGAGPLYHRSFGVRVADARIDAAGLMAVVLADPGRLMPREVVRVRREGPSTPLRRNDELVVDMPGPWNGPVRVVHAEPLRLHLVTLSGHLEAGQIEFRASQEGEQLRFEIEAWAQPANNRVHLLYGRLRLAKEIQLNMWLRSCLGAARIAGGRVDGGVWIETAVADLPRSAGPRHR